MRRSRIIAAVVAAGALCATAGIMYTAMPASAETAAFAQVSSWGSGYQGQVLVTNKNSATIDSWKVEFSLPSGSTIASSWSAAASNSGNRYVFTNMPWNGTLAPGASTNFGFVVNGSGTPADCTINGMSCDGSGTMDPTTPPVETTPPTQTTTPPTQTTTPPTQTTMPPQPPTSNTPLGINGQLSVCGTTLCNQNGVAIQLRGMSSHGLQWHSNCLKPEALDALANDWKADLLRIAMYVDEGGYVTDPGGYTKKVNDLVVEAEKRGLYSIIDFHTLNPGDPNANLQNAITFFGIVSKENAAKKGVIYEIANEPNGDSVTWDKIKTYADKVIPIIRENDPDAVIIVGTPGWSSLGKSTGSGSNTIIGNELKYPNIMYAFHFYAVTHQDSYRKVVTDAVSAKLPVFVSEWGTSEASGKDSIDLNSSGMWIDLLNSLKISYANWTFSDNPEISAAFTAGTCNGSNFSGNGVLKAGGVFVRNRILNDKRN